MLARFLSKRWEILSSALSSPVRDTWVWDWIVCRQQSHSDSSESSYFALLSFLNLQPKAPVPLARGAAASPRCRQGLDRPRGPQVTQEHLAVPPLGSWAGLACSPHCSPEPWGFVGHKQGDWSPRPGGLCLWGTLKLSSPVSHFPGIKTRVELGPRPESSDPGMVFFLSYLVLALFCFLKLL